MRGIDDLLGEHQIFAGLDESVLELLARCAANVVFERGERLFVEGGEANRFWIVRRGRVALEVSVPGGGQMVVETLGDGAVVGWSWLVPPFRWRFDATAQDLTRATVFDVRCLRDKMDADPQIGYQVLYRFMPVIVDRLQATRLRLLDVYGVPEESD